jgi:tetratricopeptide (TPR) repeat protein
MPLPPISGIDTEQILGNLYRLIEDKGFQSLEEAQDYLTSLGPEQLYELATEKPPSGPKEQARDLLHQAMAADGVEAAVALARRALMLDPDCVDAMVLINDATANSEEEHVSGLRTIVEVAERALGAEYFRENTGHFWGLHETRPYMRARFQLADALKNSLHVDEALPHFEALLELNPGDNQGARDYLLACYLSEYHFQGGRQYLDRARDLMKRYQDDSAVFLWAAVLERILAGDFPQAARALKRARSQNRFVEEYLALKKDVGELPEMYSPGADSEATYCVYVLGMSWIKQVPAYYYLQGALGEKAGKMPEVLQEKDEEEAPF